jgi:hypothetical protein
MDNDREPTEAPTDKGIGDMPPDPFSDVVILSIRIPLEWVAYGAAVIAGWYLAKALKGVR